MFFLVQSTNPLLKALSAYLGKGHGTWEGEFFGDGKATKTNLYEFEDTFFIENLVGGWTDPFEKYESN